MLGDVGQGWRKPSRLVELGCGVAQPPLVTLADSLDAPLLVLLIPDEPQFKPGLQRLIEVRFPGRRYDFDTPQKLALPFFDKNAFEYIDLLPTFQEAYNGGEPVFLNQDPHWNVRGMELTVNEIMRHVEKRHPDLLQSP